MAVADEFEGFLSAARDGVVQEYRVDPACRKLLRGGRTRIQEIAAPKVRREYGLARVAPSWSKWT